MRGCEKENFYILTCYDCERIATIFKHLNIYYSIFVDKFLVYHSLLIFAPGKSYTASSYRTPPGSEDSKGMRLSGAI
jgi:hypothetical protein